MFKLIFWSPGLTPIVLTALSIVIPSLTNSLLKTRPIIRTVDLTRTHLLKVLIQDKSANLVNIIETEANIGEAMSLLKVTDISMESRQRVNKHFVQTLSCTKGKKETYVWLKHNIPGETTRRLFDDYDYTGTWLQKMLDCTEEMLDKANKKYYALHVSCSFVCCACGLPYCKSCQRGQTIVCCTSGKKEEKVPWTSLIKRFFTILLLHIDHVKDSSLVFIIVSVLWPIQEPSSLASFPWVITFILFISILAPLLLSSFYTAWHHPTVVLGWKSWRSPISKKKVWVLRLLILLFYVFTPAVIISAKEEAIRKKQKLQKEAGTDFRYQEGSIKIELLKKIESINSYLSEASLAIVTIKSNELTLENPVQLTIQIIMVMLSTSVSVTHSGLQASFNEELFADKRSHKITITVVFLWLSIMCSMISSSLTYVKIKQDRKNNILSLTSRLVFGLRGLVAVCFKVICYVIYFAPFFGLSNLLAHWKAEQIPHEAHDDLSQFQYKPSILYRTQFDDLESPLLPPYSLYTYFTLGQASAAFLGLLMIQAGIITTVKKSFSEQFRAAAWPSKTWDILANLTIPDAFCDFDEVNNGAEKRTPEDYKKSWSAVRKENFCLLSLHCLFNFLFLIPVMVTGKFWSSVHTFHLCSSLCSRPAHGHQARDGNL